MIKFEIPQRGGVRKERTSSSVSGIIIVPDYEIRENDNVIIRKQLITEKEPEKKILAKQPTEQSNKSKRKRISRTNRKGNLNQYAKEIVQLRHEREDKSSFSGSFKEDNEMPFYGTKSSIDTELDDNGYVNVRFIH